MNFLCIFVKDKLIMFVWVYFWALYSVSLSNLSILFPIPPYDYPRFRISVKFSAIQFSRPVMSNSLWPHGPQHARFPCPSPTPKLAKTHVHWVGDVIQPSHPLSSPSPPAFNLYQHQGLLQWASILWGFPHPFSIVLINFGSFDLQYLKKRIYWDFNLNRFESIHQLGKNWHLNNIESSYPWIWNISPFTYIFFDLL